MHEVHEVAASGFGAQAAAYDRARPSYPPEAVGWLAAGLRIGPGSRVVDLAAGTGKLTALIAPMGADLVAVEPVPAMRGMLRARLPSVAVLAGVAESLPLRTGTVDAVTVAQAFHWFDRARAMAELARVLRAGGRLGLVWNARVRGEDWLDQVWAVVDHVETAAPWRAGRAGPPGSSRQLPAQAAGWSPWTTESFSHVQRVTHRDVVDRVLSISHVAALPAPRQRAVLGEVRAILGQHPQTRGQAMLDIPYRVSASWAERLAGATPG